MATSYAIKYERVTTLTGSVNTTSVATATAATIATVAPLVAPFWREYPVVGVRGVAVLGGAVSLDDAVQHAFGVLTPGEWVWVAVIHPLIT